MKNTPASTPTTGFGSGLSRRDHQPRVVQVAELRSQAERAKADLAKNLGNPDMVGDVRRFMELINCRLPESPETGREAQSQRLDFLAEELREYREAYEARDEVEMFDALLDLVYVAIGAMLLQGYPIAQGWAEVQRTNMAKRPTTPEEKAAGHWKEAIKPEGWTPPDLARVLTEGRARGEEVV